MTDRPQRIIFGDPRKIDVPSPTPEKQRILSTFLGLPESLTTPPPESRTLQVLELFSGAMEESFKPEVLSRTQTEKPRATYSNYVGVDLYESTGIEHRAANVYEVIHEFPDQSFDYIIMNHPPIWIAMAREKQWRRENSTRLRTPTLADPEKFMKFIADCTRLIKPRRDNRISIAHGFPSQDVNAVWRLASNIIPHYSEWYIHTPPTGDTAQFVLVDDKGHHRETLHFPEHAFQLVHI